MIIRKIRRKSGRQSTKASEFAYAATLSRYIVRADEEALQNLAQYGDSNYQNDLARYVVAEGKAEKALGAGALNLFGGTLDQWQAEMKAIMHLCPNSENCVDHWVLSWANGEEPTEAEVKKTVEIFARCQGLERCPAIWGYHGDTDNRHVHIEILRIDPATGKRQIAGDGWDIETAHRAKAVIEDRFPHWSRETGSRYRVVDAMLIDTRDNNTVGPANDPERWARPNRRKDAASIKPEDISSKLDQKSRDEEERTGFKSRARVALEIAAPIALASTSWDECHRRLAAEGIEICMTEARGAQFIIDGKPVKASINRKTSYKQLKDLYQEDFRPSRYKVQHVPRREMWPNDVKRREYYAAKRQHEALLAGMSEHYASSQGRSAPNGTMADALKTAKAAAAFPSFDQWISGASPVDPEAAISDKLGYGVFEAPGNSAALTKDNSIYGFVPVKLKDRVVYFRDGQPGTRPVFVDYGHKVIVNASLDREAIRAAMLLLANRDPSRRIIAKGSKEFQQLALDIAIQEGIQLGGKLARQQPRQIRQKPQHIEQPVATNKSGDAPAGPMSESPIHSPSRPAQAATEQSAKVNAASKPDPSSQRHASNDSLLTLLGRLFHRSDWEPNEYWGPRAANEPMSEHPTSPRDWDQAQERQSEDDLGARAKALRNAAYAAAMAAQSQQF
ncbi:MAG: relaxase/mobilization nuclease domain-containing protein [Erythrobacter sp.]